MSRHHDEASTRSRYTPIKGNRCAYCGLPSDTYDHAYPVSAMARLLDVEGPDCNIRSFIVPACRECNTIAGNMLFPTFNEKRDHIRRILRIRYASSLSYNYTIDDLLYEKDEIILERVDCMRKRSEVEHRLYYQHLYDLSHLSPKELEERKKASKYIYQRKDGRFIVQFRYNKRNYYLGPFWDRESAIRARDELKLTLSSSGESPP